jgi:drug/metabolite transporter (DMT)-like permease
MSSDPAPRAGGGLGLALLSAASFSTSGSFARSLADAGWSSGAAVAVRVGVAAAVLAVPALFALRRRWGSLRNSGLALVLYGLVAVAGCQLCYFNAVAHLSVGVALLLEYLGTVLVVGWMWLRHGHTPRRLTVAGAAIAVMGLVLVLDLTGDHHVDLIGVLWGLGAAVGLAVYFVLSGEDDNAMPPIAFACGGMTVGAVTLGALGTLGALPMHAARGTVALVGHQVSWLVPILGLSLVAAAIAYVAGIAAARRLGPKLASFVGLTEVVFAVGFAWLVLGELPGPIQLAGGVLIVAGVALVRMDELRPALAEPGAAGEPLVA